MYLVLHYIPNGTEIIINSKYIESISDNSIICGKYEYKVKESYKEIKDMLLGNSETNNGLIITRGDKLRNSDDEILARVINEFQQLGFHSCKNPLSLRMMSKDEIVSWLKRDL